MPFITNKTKSTKWRLLISGFPNTGKTTSLVTFVYGPFDYWNYDTANQHHDEQSEHDIAVDYANNKQMVILVCPGEKGVKSLPEDNDNITSYYYQTDEDTSDVRWSREALKQFDATSAQIVKQKPDILVIDGFHSLWAQIMNRTTNGDYLSGFDIGEANNPYASAKLYSQAHGAFGQYITSLYHSSIPIIIATTWEEWEAGSSSNQEQKGAKIQDTRYLWPAIPGKMAKAIVGQFDARISAKIGRRCFHKDCVDSQNNQEHYLWQVLSKDDTMGLGIKGMRRIPQQLKEKPFIHQRADILWQLIEACS